MKVRAALGIALAAATAACTGTPVTTAVVEVAGLEFRVQVATSEQAQRDGLGGRDTLPVDGGMLFAFEDRQERQVWMAGMTMPLDVAWIVDGRVLAIDTLDPCTRVDQSQCPRWTSPSDVDALLEVPASALDGIEPGTPVTIRDR